MICSSYSRNSNIGHSYYSLTEFDNHLDKLGKKINNDLNSGRNRVSHFPHRSIYAYLS